MNNPKTILSPSSSKFQPFLIVAASGGRAASIPQAVRTRDIFPGAVLNHQRRSSISGWVRFMTPFFLVGAGAPDLWWKETQEVVFTWKVAAAAAAATCFQAHSGLVCFAWLATPRGPRRLRTADLDRAPLSWHRLSSFSVVAPRWDCSSGSFSVRLLLCVCYALDQGSFSPFPPSPQFQLN